MKKNYKFPVVLVAMVASFFLTTSLSAQNRVASIDQSSTQIIQNEDGKSRVMSTTNANDGLPVAVQKVVTDKEQNNTAIIYVDKQELYEESTKPSLEPNTEPK